MANIQDLLKQMEGMSYNAPNISKSMDFSYKAPEYKKLNLKPYNFTAADFGSLNDESKKKSGFSAPNLFDVLSGTLGLPGGIVTDGASHFLEDFMKFDKNSPVKSTLNLLKDLNPSMVAGRVLSDGVKGQMKSWKDGELSWGDIPGVGFLHGADKGMKRGSDIMEQLGVDNRWGKVGGGLAIDIAFDPLTYVTGGASAAGKLGKLAEAKKITELGEKMGVAGKFKNKDEFLDAAIDNMRVKYAKYPNLADKMVAKKVDEIHKLVDNARSKAFNANINKFGARVPFTKKPTMLGDYGKKNPLYRTEATLGAKYSHVAENLLRDVSKGNDLHQKQLIDSVLKRYDVGSIEKLTKTHVDDLVTELNSLKGLQNNKSMYSNSKLSDILKSQDPMNTVDRVKSSKEFNKNIAKLDESYDGMNNAKTRFEHSLDSKNPFDARTLKTGDNFLDSMADHIADASSQRVGENAKYTKPMSTIEKFIKTNKISKTKMSEAIYHIEGKSPKSYGDDWKASAEVIELANLIKPLLKQMGSEEQAAGVLSKMKSQYFPHVLNKSEKELKEIMDFEDRNSGLKGLKETSKHDKARKSFQTLADRDNHISKLEKAIQKSTDPVEKEALLKQQERVAELFETDIVSALTRRVSEGIRAKAMKDMQGKLSRFGMMVSNPDDISKAKGLKKLDAGEAKKLGLPKGEHYIHPQVLDGMKRVDDIFTDQGMNKLVRDLNATTDIWKNFVTTFKPSHYVNNIIGNMINNMAAGVKYSDYKSASKLLKGYRNGTLTPSQTKIMDKAYKHNVISGGFMTDNMFNYHFDDPRKLEKAARWVGQNKGTRTVRNVGESIDDFSRLANFMGGMRQYGSTEKAAGQVRKYLFNYNELTSADRRMRTVVPFWNWTKRNIPLQANLLLENPKFAISIERFKTFFNEGEEGQDWQKETGIKVPGTNYYTGVPSPTSDLNTMLDPMSMLGSMAPVPKMIVENKMNKEFFTGRPISYGEETTQPEDLPRYLAKNFGITGNIYDAISGKKSAGEALVNLFKPSSKIQSE